MTDEEAATRLVARLTELTETAARLRVGSPSYYGVRPEVLLESAGAAEAEAEAEAISTALHALRVKEQLVEALKAGLELVEAVVDDYSADHHEDDCPGDCEDHAVIHFINAAHSKATAALKAAKETP